MRDDEVIAVHFTVFGIHCRANVLNYRFGIGKLKITVTFCGHCFAIYEEYIRIFYFGVPLGGLEYTEGILDGNALSTYNDRR